MYTIGHSLHSAARDGNLEELCGLFREWKSLPDEKPEKRIIDAFMIAVQRGHTSCVRVFVKETGVDVDVLSVGRTALHNAAAEGHTDTVRCLVSELGATALSRATYSRGYTALHFAAARGHLEVVSFLVGFLLNQKDHNSSDIINVRCGNGATPLFAAVEARQTRVVEWLLRQPGVDLSVAVDVSARAIRDKKTPLHEAIHARSDGETVRILLEYGADVNALDSSGNTPLHCATCIGCPRYLVEEAGADVAIRNYKGQTALYLAADMRRREEIRVLVANRGVF